MNTVVPFPRTLDEMPLYASYAGEVISRDGRRIDYADVPDLIVANGSQALQLWSHGRRATARRFARDAREMNQAYVEAKLWRAASAPTALEKG